MMDDSKLAWLLDDPETRVIVFGLAHSGPESSSTDSGPVWLREVVTRLASITDAGQYQSWLSDQETNDPITIEQVRTALGDDAISSLSQYARISPSAVTWQVAAVLPALVDAITPDGKLLDSDSIGQQLRAATAADDKSNGPFG